MEPAEQFRVFQWLDTSVRNCSHYPTIYCLQQKDPRRGWVYVTVNNMPVLFDNAADASNECSRRSSNYLELKPDRNLEEGKNGQKGLEIRA